MPEIEYDAPTIDSWALLYSEASQDEKKRILTALCKYIDNLNYFAKKEYNAYILNRHRELNEQEKIEAFRRQRAADLKKLDDRLRERKKSLK